MEIAYHHIRYFEVIRGENKFICPAIEWFQVPACRYRTFKGSYHSGSDCTDPLFFIFGFIHNFSCFFGNYYPFRINFMLCKILNINTPEVTETHMQCNFGKFDAYYFKLFQEFPAEMQSGRRSRHSTFILGKNGLVPFTVIRFNRSVYKFWKRCFPKSVEGLFKFLISTVKQKSEGSSSGGCIVNYFRNQKVIFPKI